MRKHVIIISIICFCMLIAVGIRVIHVDADGNNFFKAGEYFKDAQAKEENDAARGNSILASYNGHNITADNVEYQRNMNIMRDAEAAERYDSDIDIINRIIENIILFEEAQRLGFLATQEEINQMVDNAEISYSIPEGKVAMDAYLDGAGITFEEYLEVLREQAPRIIARQKLKNEIGRQYCEEKGLEYTNVNPPEGMLEVQEKYVADLFKQHKDKIVYYIATQ